ncbi:MAG: sigma-70 family RNA polymerase sigma factor [Oscillospiraceae bacterium]|nr:sigma-70 family RNA polymerase sigma factor [Oscillospiraceae bacterium]
MTEKQFQEMIVQYQRLVFSVCLQFTGDAAQAEDLTQETFLSAYLHRDSCPPEAARPWLCRIAANKAKDYLKSAWHRKVSGFGDDYPPDAPEPAADVENLAAARLGEAQIKQAIDSLNEPYRKVAMLFFLRQYTVNEIGQLLGRPPKTIHTQLGRARGQLRLLLTAQKGEQI